MMAEPPALNVTEPSPTPGSPVPAPVPVTVAVNTNGCPKVWGLPPVVLAIAVEVVRLTDTPFDRVKVPEFWPAPHPSLYVINDASYVPSADGAVMGNVSVKGPDPWSALLKQEGARRTRRDRPAGRLPVVA